VKVRKSLVAGAAVAAAAVSLGTAGAAQAHPQHRSDADAAVFVQTDNPDGNSVVAYHRSADGTLQHARTYATGGRGGVLAGSQVDHLASQGALARSGSTLFAVNAGSNTLSVFGVRGDQLRRTQVVGTGGSFPVSVAVHGSMVYVLNARDGGSIQGFLRLGDHLVRVPGWHRGLGLDPDQTPEFTSTPGQVAFTPDGTKLVVTTKANGNAIKVFPVSLLGLGRAVTTSDAGNVPFAVTFDSAGRLLVAEAGPNAIATFTVGHNGSLHLSSRTATGQQATCWIARSGSSVYASNAGSATVSQFRSEQGVLTSVGTVGTDPGTVDAGASSDGRFVYVQTGKTGTVDEFRVGSTGTLTSIGSVTVPGAAGGEGIVAS
jgi:6-phosphogluconolactonase (cycloisomerase 2 family)